MSLAEHETIPASDDPTAVAVIGVSCRFGPLSSPAAYWDLLVGGGTAIRHYSDEELVDLGHDPAVLRRPGFVPAGCAMPDADRFDAGLFGFNPRQAEWLDPQQRILLELAWSAMEDGGLVPDDTPGATGVFTSSARPTLPPVGITDLDAAGMARFSSADRDFAATRIAHQLGTTGPALNVQTACSSSLVAVHLAVESLLGGESDTAVVAAVSLHLPQAGYPSSPDMILSPNGECRPFDERADGTVFGNGGGAVVLRRLADALRDGAPVRAVIRGSAVNNDGATRQHYQAPSPDGQAAVLREALAVGAAAPASVGMIETHGTGTQLGDPVEFSALRKVYGDGAEPGARQPCALGSAKSVVGHLNTAAGLAGLVKCVLALEQGLVPPQHGFDSPNPLLGLASSRFYVPVAPGPWPVADGPRRAAVSSFGIGGTNTHVILEQAPEPTASPAPAHGRALPLVLSAGTPATLRDMAEQLATHLEGPGRSAALDAVARTLRDGRSRLPHRLAVLAADPAQAARALRDRARDAGAREGGAAVTPQGVPGSGDADGTLASAVRAWESGDTDDVPLPGAERGPRLNLPGYSFDHGRSWPVSGPREPTAPGTSRRGMLDRNTSTLHGVSFERDLDPGEPLVADHVVNGRPLLPAAAFMECVRAAAAAAADAAPHRVTDLVLERPAEVAGPLTLRAEVTAEDGALEVAVASSVPGANPGEGGRRVHVTARVPQPPQPAARPAPPAHSPLAEVRARCPVSLPPDDLYALFSRHGVDYGPRYRVVTEFSHGEHDVLARISGPDGTGDGDAGEVLTPELLDGALQTVIGFLTRDGGAAERYLPFAVERLEVYEALPRDAVVHARPRRPAGSGDRIRKFDITVLSPDGMVRAELAGLALRPTAAPTAAGIPPGDSAHQAAGPGTADDAAAAETIAAAPEEAGHRADDPLLGIVRGVLADVTGHPLCDVQPDVLFDDLAIDSLAGIRVVDRLSERFGRLPRTLLFECRCATEIVEHLRAELPSTALEQALAESTPPAADPQAALAAPAPRADRACPASIADAPAEPAAAPVDDGHAIAVIGLAGRFPQADGLEAFWRNLLDGRDSITEIPADRWPLEGFFRPERDVPNTSYAKWGGFLDGIDRFDAPLFNISAREAGTIDPQARLFLESCWAAIEDTGYTPADLAPDIDPRRPRDVGVYAGAMYSEYQVHEGEERLRGNAVHANSAFWCIANRVSYFFGFEGPSVAVDTACSSGLSSIHLACQALRAGECAVAVAGAVNVTVHPNKYLMLSQGKFLASEGRCRSFGLGGDGYVPGEGVGTVVLKPLAAALRDGDPVHAVIRGSAVNHGGRTNGYTVPNPKAQARLVGKALGDAGLTARDLTYVETHGTGTSLGDPLEIRGLTSAFARDGWTAETGGDRCPIGSVKSNIGHLESAAGMAAFAKVLLQFRHRTLVPSLHADPPNPEIDFAATPFVVQQQVSPWTPAGQDGRALTLRAGISSFGAGGANAHVVVEEGPQRAPAPPDDGRTMTAFLSARTPAALAELAGRMRTHLSTAWAGDDGPARADVVYTLAVGRTQLSRRAAVRHSTRQELLAGLARIEARPEGAAAEAGEAGHGPPVADWLSGKRADLETACGARDLGRRVSLPHYPFEPIRCWYDNQLQRQAGPDGTRQPGEDHLVRGHLRDFGLPPRPEEDLSPAPVSQRPESAPAPAPPAAPQAPAARPDAAHIRATLLDALAKVLYEDPASIEDDAPFEELGLDSLLAEELIVTARKRLGLALDANDLFSYTTIARLTEYLAESGTPVAAAGDGPAPGEAGTETPVLDGADAVLDALDSGSIGLDEAVALLEASR